jgi:hypothetical protein
MNTTIMKLIIRWSFTALALISVALGVSEKLAFAAVAQTSEP